MALQRSSKTYVFKISGHWSKLNIENNTTKVYVQKVKFRHIGELGESEFKYNIQNGRYIEIGEHENNNSYLKLEQQSLI